jgi:hypothetical protein
MGIRGKLFSAAHSQTAGQIENLNEYSNQRLRPFVNHFHYNWLVSLPVMDAVQNSLPYDSIGVTPNEVLGGFPMPLPLDCEA